MKNKTRKSYFEAFRKNLVPQKFWTIQYMNTFIQMVKLKREAKNFDHGTKICAYTLAPAVLG